MFVPVVVCRGPSDVTVTFFEMSNCSDCPIYEANMSRYLFYLFQRWLRSLCFLLQSYCISHHAHRCLPVWPLQARDSVTGAASADFLGKNTPAHALPYTQCYLKDQYHLIYLVVKTCQLVDCSVCLSPSALSYT